MHEKPYKQIVILSGKGGTGKTTLAAALAGLLKKKLVIDCDVDAANLHIILKPQTISSHAFYGGKKAAIAKDECSECGLCASVCRFEAINNFVVDVMSCEGCGFCFNVCPSKAISFKRAESGSYLECKLPDDTKFYYAKLLPGEGNSGKLISKIKSEAIAGITQNTEWVIVDGPPGIGCPVNASITTADYAVIVTEPTLSGLHDLKRLVKLLNTFNLKAGIVINKYDLNEAIEGDIYKYANTENIPVIGRIPFDKIFVDTLINGQNIVDASEKYREVFSVISGQIESRIETSNN